MYGYHIKYPSKWLLWRECRAAVCGSLYLNHFPDVIICAFRVFLFDFGHHCLSVRTGLYSRLTAEIGQWNSVTDFNQWGKSRAYKLNMKSITANMLYQHIAHDFDLLCKMCPWMCCFEVMCNSAHTYMPTGLWPCGWPACHNDFGRHSHTRPYLHHSPLCVSGNSGWRECHSPALEPVGWWAKAHHFDAMWPLLVPRPEPDSLAWEGDPAPQWHHWAPAGKPARSWRSHLETEGTNGLSETKCYFKNTECSSLFVCLLEIINIFQRKIPPTESWTWGQ